MKGKFLIYRGLRELFTITNPTIPLLLKLKYQRGLTIIPILE